jgi:hypothetical protein
MESADWMIVEREIKSRGGRGETLLHPNLQTFCGPNLETTHWVPGGSFPSVNKTGHEFEHSFEYNTQISPPGVMLN